jgi:hypothetical protein
LLHSARLRRWGVALGMWCSDMGTNSPCSPS